MDTLPVELLHEIASNDIEAYRTMLAVPLFARSLNPGIITDYKIHFGYSVRIKKATTEWYKDGKLHRADGPAIESPLGDKEWLINGVHHRVDGPAIEYSDGTICWYHRGEYHCTSAQPLCIQMELNFGIDTDKFIEMVVLL